MLQQIRDKISGWVAIVFLGAIAVVFIFWGIQFESTVTTAAAKVNGEDVPVEAVRRAWQDRQTELQRVTRDELPEDLVKSEQQRLLTEFITRELLVQRANKLGYRVSDKEIVDALGQIEALQIDGKFDPDRYKALLRAQGRSEVEFEREFRRDLEISQLRNGIAISAFATPGEMRRRVELEGETRDVDFAVLPAASFAAQATATPEEIASWYEKHKSDYMTQETVSLQYLQLNLADIAATLEVTDEGLRAFYDQVAHERYMDAERRRARHILVESGADDAAALKKAEGLLARAKAGEDFAKLAADNSDDPGSKGQGGDLGWSTRESFVQPFAEALFGMQQGELRGPVKTQFGYHIIRLEEIAPAHQRTFEEVRADLETDYRREQAQSIFYEKSQNLADEAFAALNELDSVATKLGLPVQKVDGYTRQGGGPFGPERKVVDAVFSDDVLKDRQNSPAISLGEDSVVVVRVADHKPSVQRSLDEVRAEIEVSLRDQSARKAAEAAAKAAVARVADGASLADATSEFGLQPVGVTSVTRTSEGVPPALLKAVFTAPHPATGKASAGTAVLANGDVALFAVSAVRKGSMESPDAAARFGETIQNSQRQAATAEFAAYVKELERNSKVTRNEKVFE
jgi:peptidyl-prolyl cis-trans isomerase D